MKLQLSSILCILAVNAVNVVGDDPIPTCDAIKVTVINDCAKACTDVGDEIDIKESRDVNGKYKCYCTNKAICNDEPRCSDLLVVPGIAQERCTTACPEGVKNVEVVDDVQFAGDSEAANKNQTHFRVACYCDDVKECGTDFVLFSDLTFLPACSNIGSQTTLGIESEDACTTYCSDFGFTGSSYDGNVRSCSCSNADGTAVACDDRKANDDRGEFNDCFAEVGVSAVDCPTPAPNAQPAGNAPTTSSAAYIFGIDSIIALLVAITTLGNWVFF